ncbi:MAG: glycosyltransferase, partial [Treponema sp.]|nr:glycosyltransferase [Treponema sp.]
MKSHPLISIITINYNNKDGLKKTIDSVAAQTFQGYEHIIVDGGSTDGSAEVIKDALKNKDYAAHVSYWCSEKDGGIYPAMNKGVERAGGEYCLMLNSGDYLAGKSILEKAAKSFWTED